MLRALVQLFPPPVLSVSASCVGVLRPLLSVSTAGQPASRPPPRPGRFGCAVFELSFSLLAHRGCVRACVRACVRCCRFASRALLVACCVRFGRVFAGVLVVCVVGGVCVLLCAVVCCCVCCGGCVLCGVRVLCSAQVLCAWCFVSWLRWSVGRAV